MEKGQKVIFDSGCGFTIGVYEKPHKMLNGDFIGFNHATSHVVMFGETPSIICDDMLFPYSKELEDELTELYEY